MTRAAICILLASMLGWSAGCSSTPKESDNAKLGKWLMEASRQLPPGIYRVDPPDVLAITSPGIKEMDGQGGTIRPDGKITLNLIGDVQCAGRTTDEIAQEIIKRLAPYYNMAAIDLTVSVKEFRSKFICVFGQVQAGGVKPFTGSDTVLKVIADARLNDAAWPQRVVIVRPSDDPSIKQKVTVDLKRMYERGITDQNYMLEAGDLVYVPPSPLAEVGMTFKKLFSPLVPLASVATMARGGL